MRKVLISTVMAAGMFAPGFSWAEPSPAYQDMDSLLVERGLIDRLSPTAHREAETAKAHRG